MNRLKPSVSVVIPFHNVNIEIFQSTLTSVLSQTYPNLGITIINDGSNELSSQLLDELVARIALPKIKILKTNNQGQGPARILGIEQTDSDLVSLCDADDLWHPDKLQKQVAFLEQNTGYHAVVHPMHKINTHGALIGKVHVPYDRTTSEDAFKTFILLLYCNPFPTSSVTFKRVPFVQAQKDMIFGKDINNDRTFWMAMALNGSRFGLIDECLGSYRVHEENFSKEIFINYNHKFSHLFHFLDLSSKKFMNLGYNFNAIRKDVLHHAHIRYASRLYKGGKKKEAFEAVKASFRYKSSLKALRRYIKYALASAGLH